MKQGECWCNESENEEKIVYWLWDKDHQSVLGIDGKNAMLAVRISPEQGYVGLPISFCPFCGRQLADDEDPRCPIKETDR